MSHHIDGSYNKLYIQPHHTEKKGVVAVPCNMNCISNLQCAIFISYAILSEAICLLNNPGLEHSADSLLFLCSNFYFYPPDMILIVSCRPQRLNGLVKPPQSPLLQSSLGRRGTVDLPISASLSEILASFRCYVD